MAENKPGPYRDRNLLVQTLAMLAQERGWPVWKSLNPKLNNSQEWPVVFIEILFLPEGERQISYHIPASELIIELPLRMSQWDGHTVAEKQLRLEELIRLLGEA